MEYALKPGCHFFQRSDGGWYIVDERESAARAPVPENVARAFLNGTSTQGDGQGEELNALISALNDRGVLHVSPYSHTSTSPSQVCLSGAGNLKESFQKILEEAHPNAQCVDFVCHETDLNQNSVVITFDGHPQPKKHQEIDQLTLAAGARWVRCCQEGAILSIFEPSLGSSNARYSDLMHRRLAASPIGDVLKDLWHQLDGNSNTELNLPLAHRHMAAGLVLDLIESGKSGSPTNEQIDYEICLDLELLRLTEHPVLPIPKTLSAHPLSGNTSA